MGWNVVTRWTQKFRAQPDLAARAVIDQANKDAWDAAYAKAAQHGGAAAGYFDHYAAPKALIAKYGRTLPREIRAAMSPIEQRTFDRYNYLP
jgi:hypothetical protein